MALRPAQQLGVCHAARLAAIVGVALAFAPTSVAQESGGGDDEGRIAVLNRTFLEHVRSLGPEHAIAAATVESAWENVYSDGLSEGFVPDALAEIYPEYREALDAFDNARFETAIQLFGELRDHPDRFVSANARYFYARASAATGQFEKIEADLSALDADAEDLAQHTPYAPHLWLIKAMCEARDLRFDQATQTLNSLSDTFEDAPEAVRVGAAQLLLEVERREQGTLGEVAVVMDYVADRLHVSDRAERVRERQEDVLAMLDKLIEEQQQKEQQSGGGKGGQGGRGEAPAQAQGQGREKSEAPGGSGKIGELHRAAEATPGEAWGKLPPDERERILQSIRERFPSRYRRLVEQYYRNLAEEEQ